MWRAVGTLGLRSVPLCLSGIPARRPEFQTAAAAPCYRRSGRVSPCEFTRGSPVYTARGNTVYSSMAAGRGARPASARLRSR
jgi:hypothetical protein